MYSDPIKTHVASKPLKFDEEKNKNWGSGRESYLPEVTQQVGGEAETRTNFQASVFSTDLQAAPPGALVFLGVSMDQSMGLVHRW